MGSAPAARSAAADPSDRASARTGRPDRTSRRRTAPPTPPLPPVTRTGSVTRSRSAGSRSAILRRVGDRAAEPNDVLDARQDRDDGGRDHRPLVQVQRPDRLAGPKDRQEDREELDVRLGLAPDGGPDEVARGSDRPLQSDDQDLPADDDERDPRRDTV